MEQGQRAAIAEMLTPDAVLHEGGTDSVGLEGFYAFYDRLNAAFSDFHVTVHDTIAEGDRACVRWTCTCKHTGDALGIPASLQDGSCNRNLHRQNWDMLGLLEQIQGLNRSGTYVSAS